VASHSLPCFTPSLVPPTYRPTSYSFPL
jgi:hypothetical protein